jgi:hypothetical protein
MPNEEHFLMLIQCYYRSGNCKLFLHVIRRLHIAGFPLSQARSDFGRNSGGGAKKFREGAAV